MTKDEAKTKWCPFVRLLVSGHGHEMIVHNRVLFRNHDGSGTLEESPPDCLCIASACMAWRWERNSEEGYCGLAGKP